MAVASALTAAAEAAAGLTKFGRNWQMIAWPKVPYKSGVPGIPSLALPPILTLSYPLTVEFDVYRNSLSSTNYATIKVYNLSQFHRNQLRYSYNDVGYVQMIALKAGYGPAIPGQTPPAGIPLGVINPYLPTVFFGNIIKAQSHREGTNIVTVIEAHDSGIAATQGSIVLPLFPAGTPLKTVLSAIAALVPNTFPGAIGNYVTPIPKNLTFNGNPLQVLSELAPNQIYVDLGRVNVLQDNEVIAIPTFPVSPFTGLLNTPQLEQFIFTFDMLFEPRLKVGQVVTIQSSIEDGFAAPTPVKLVGLKHRGTISGAVSGEVITEGKFLFPGLSTIPVAQITPPNAVTG